MEKLIKLTLKYSSSFFTFNIIGILCYMTLIVSQDAHSSNSLSNINYGEGTFRYIEQPTLDTLVEEILSQKNIQNGDIVNIIEPYDGVHIPSDIATFIVKWNSIKKYNWLLSVIKDTETVLNVLTDNNTWLPNNEVLKLLEWQSSEDVKYILNIKAIAPASSQVVDQKNITIYLSRDTLDAPLLYLKKEVPFSVAQANPEDTQWIRADLNKPNPKKLILDGLPVCGNCHSFAQDVNLFGTDLDFNGDKGSYLITTKINGEENSKDEIISFTSQDKLNKGKTLGLFSKISADGRFIFTTVEERSLFIRMNDSAFSQLFYPVSGKIGVFDRVSANLFHMNGASSEEYVQTAPELSPDGKTLVFSRSKVSKKLSQAVDDETTNNEPITSNIEELNSKYPIQFDLFTVPFPNPLNKLAKPLLGASNNGMSNYFARYSPDGKWIVFCQSPTGLVLQPNSKLYIIPANGGVAKALDSNVKLMNSWHSWSPNGKWIVFSGKDNNPVTELFIAHIDDHGKASSPLRLFRLSSHNEALMVPEWIPKVSEKLSNIKFNFNIDGSKQSKNGNIR